MSAPTVKVNHDTDQIQCPRCLQWKDIDEALQYCDYVDIPMLWCDTDNGDDRMCGYFFLDPESIKIDNKCNAILQDELPCLFVERKTDYCMARYRSERVLSIEEMTRLLDSYHKKDGPLYNDEVLHELKITEREYKDETRMNISVPVESFNLMTPITPYHPNVQFDHDGVYVYCTVRMPDGSVQMQRYWGD
jgi:hypothetical protein